MRNHFINCKRNLLYVEEVLTQFIYNSNFKMGLRLCNHPNLYTEISGFFIVKFRGFSACWQDYAFGLERRYFNIHHTLRHLSPLQNQEDKCAIVSNTFSLENESKLWRISAQIFSSYNLIYIISKKSWPIYFSAFTLWMGQDFLNI